MKEKILKDLFDELLDRWYWAEDSCINSMSTDLNTDYEELEANKKEYKKKFIEALNS